MSSVASGHEVERVKLGVWVVTQRSFYRAKKLAPGRIARLGKLRGWEWIVGT